MIIKDMKEKSVQQIIDLGRIVQILWKKRKTYLFVWIITFILSCIWIFPQPRYYDCDVALAPEMASESLAGDLTSIASSFGFNLGDMAGSDAIYPLLYPDLFGSPEFIVELFDIRIKTIDGEVDTDYYTYLKEHQKENVLTKPYYAVSNYFKQLFESDKSYNVSGNTKRNPFMLSKKDYVLMMKVQDNITCAVDKKTNVISISVRDQDPLVCATLADSVKEHLQDFIIRYRTSKARLDYDYYQHLVDSAKIEYDKAMESYAVYTDSHKDIILQAYISERDKLENDMQTKYTTYNTFVTQLQAMKAKVQERTPSFTTLKSATVPIKPSGPKRMIFVVGMMILAFIVTSIYHLRGLIVLK